MSVLAATVLAAVLGPPAVLPAGDVVALLPMRRGARLPEVTAWAQAAVARELAARVDLAAPETVRDILRELRLRSPDTAAPEALREVAERVGAQWLVAASLHDASAEEVPEIALSLRLYRGSSGEVVATLFHAESGLDRESVLGLGRVDEVEELLALAAAEVVSTLVAGRELPRRRRPETTPARPELGTLALVPFSTTLPDHGFEIALEASEALRAILEQRRVPLAQPACVRQALRGAEGDVWGELSAEARERVRRACAADTVVTGAVERWESKGGGAAGPVPVVAVALRLLDAETGRILRTASLEEGGAERPGWFGLATVRSRGELLQRLLDRLVARLLDERGVDGKEPSS